MDYQWPQFFLKPESAPMDQAPVENGGEKELCQIEAFFTERFNCPTCLFPSARSAISWILKYNGINRSHVLWAPKWSSHCVFNVLSYYGNPTIHVNSEVDLFLAVHKWGFVYKAPSNTKVIEDSVDSLITQPESLFPNRGDFEVFSLPKLIGSQRGGLITTKDHQFLQFIYEERQRNQGPDQNKLESYGVADSQEFHNLHLNTQNLQDILKKLPFYQSSIDLSLKRIDQVEKIFKTNLFNSSRIGPVVPLPQSTYLATPEIDYMVRRFSFQYSLADLKYEECYLLPIHIGISHELFDKLLKGIQKKL